MASYVVILSGGMDSASLLYHLSSLGHQLAALTIDYGQRHVREIESARQLVRHANSLRTIDEIAHKVVDLTALGELGASALTRAEVAVPEGHYEDATMRATVVPNRNMTMLSLGLAWAITLDFDGVAYAAHAGDHAVYPDCRFSFAEALGSAFQLADYKRRSLVRPFVRFDKAGVALIGQRSGVPFHLTWSCYQGADVHCGKCGTCVERIEAFRNADVPDPTTYAVDPEQVYAELQARA